jgi:hypothetical protein
MRITGSMRYLRISERNQRNSEVLSGSKNTVNISRSSSRSKEE